MGGRTVAEWQQAMHYREFVRWKVSFELEDVATKHEDYYLAQIAMEVRRSYVKDPRKVTLADFILNFTSGATAKAKPLSREQRVQNSKNYWMGLLSFFSNKKKIPPQKKDQT